MQMFPEFNKHLAAPSFNADAFTLVLELGGHYFCNLVGATNLCYRKAKGTRLTYIRMDLKPNEGGFDRLEIHYQPDKLVRMDFYMFAPMPGGMAPVKGPVTVFENVDMEYMFQAFKDATGFDLEEGQPEEATF